LTPLQYGTGGKGQFIDGSLGETKRVISSDVVVKTLGRQSVDIGLHLQYVAQAIPHRMQIASPYAAYGDVGAIKTARYMKSSCCQHVRFGLCLRALLTTCSYEFPFMLAQQFRYRQVSMLLLNRFAKKGEPVNGSDYLEDIEHENHDDRRCFGWNALRRFGICKISTVCFASGEYRDTVCTEYDAGYFAWKPMGSAIRATFR
jgi:hypothetical protein